MMKQKLAAALTRPETWLALLASWLTLSALRSFHTPWAQAALTEWLRWMAGIGLAVTLAYARPSALIVARAAVVLVSCIAGFGAWQGLVPAKGGLAGPFLDHQLCASALLVLLPWTFAVGVRDPQTYWRWAAQIVGTAGLVCLALTLTRSAWAGTSVVAVFLGTVYLIRIQDRARALRQCILGAVLVVGVCTAFFLAIQPTELSTQFAKRTATLKAVDRDSSFEARLPRWHGAARMAESHPVWGWGLGRYPGLQSAWTGQGRILGPNTHPGLSEQAHDLYLQTAADTGVIGLLLYLGVVLTTGASCYRAFQSCAVRREPLHSMLLLAGLATLIGQAVDAFASPSWQYGEVSLFWWAAVGLTLQIARAPLNFSVQLLPAFTPKRQRFFVMASSAFITPLIVGLFQPSLLLLPAEAYSAPTGWTYVGPTTVSSNATSVSVGNTVTFLLTAPYNKSNGSSVIVDVSKDSTATYVTSVHRIGSSTSETCSSSNINTFTIPSKCGSISTSGNIITVNASFKDKAVNHSASPININVQ